jgi:lactate dehydrogenase-like 2-hydroxyacid dehydrogenase
LRRLDNVVLTSHLGWPADSTYRTMAEGMVSIIESYLDGKYDRAINPEALKNRR